MCCYKGNFLCFRGSNAGRTHTAILLFWCCPLNLGALILHAVLLSQVGFCWKSPRNILVAKSSCLGNLSRNHCMIGIVLSWNLGCKRELALNHGYESSNPLPFCRLSIGSSHHLRSNLSNNHIHSQTRKFYTPWAQRLLGFGCSKWSYRRTLSRFYSEDSTHREMVLKYGSINKFL